MKKTSVRGVKQIGPGRYQLRVTYVDPKTDKERNLVREVSAVSVTEAARMRLELRAMAVSSRLPRERARLRLADAATSWLASRAPHLKPSTLAQYGTQLDAWIEAIGADVYLDTIYPENVAAAMARWSSNGLTPETVNGRLRCLRTFAREHGQAGMVDRVRTYAEAERKARGMTAEEIAAWLTRGRLRWRQYVEAPAARHVGAWWPLLATSFWTGMRFGEVSALLCEDYDAKRGVLDVTRAQWRGAVGTTKTRAGVRVIAVSDALAEVLRQHVRMLKRTHRYEPGALLFPSPRTGRHVNNTGARKAMLLLCREAGIGRKGETGWTIDRPTLHTLRHALNNLIRQVTTEHVRQKMIGHTSWEMGAVYSEVEIREQRAALARVAERVK